MLASEKRTRLLFYDGIYEVLLNFDEKAKTNHVIDIGFAYEHLLRPIRSLDLAASHTSKRGPKCYKMLLLSPAYELAGLRKLLIGEEISIGQTYQSIV